MAKARLHLVYDRKTGRYEMVCDMEQKTLDLKVHNRAHDRLVREFAGSEAEIETVEPGASVKSEAETEPPRAERAPIKQRQ